MVLVLLAALVVLEVPEEQDQLEVLAAQVELEAQE